MGDLLLVTGDSSADQYAANLVSYLNDSDYSGTIYAAAGHRTASAGANLVENVVDRSVVGFSEITGSLPYFYNLLHKLNDLVEDRPIDAVLLMDFPGFNLSLAWLSKIRELDIPLFYYITPQVWAWWRWRIKLLKKWFDELFVIFPFEKDLYECHGIDAQFVGHPMLEGRASEPDYDLFETMDISRGKSIVSFFPGSRDHEVQQHLDVMVETARRVDAADEQFYPVFSAAPTVNQEYFETVFREKSCEYPVWGGDSRSLLEDSTLALLASGTVTMEATFCRTPMIVGYRTSWLTYGIANCVSNMENVAMPNLIHDEPFVPEFIQGDFTPEQLSGNILEYLSDSVKREEQREILSSITETFERRHPSAEVGQRLLETLEY